MGAEEELYLCEYIGLFSVSGLFLWMLLTGSDYNLVWF